jgi:hypothetical protein
LVVIAIAFVALPGVPHVLLGAAALLLLPHCTWMPTAPGKLFTLFASIVAFVMLAALDALPNAITRIPEPIELGKFPPVVVPLVNVLLEIVRLAIVPAVLRMPIP